MPPNKVRREVSRKLLVLNVVVYMVTISLHGSKLTTCLEADE